MNPQKGYSILREFMTEDRDVLFRQVAAARTRYLTVVVEDLYQPHNASAVLRSCDCFGVQDAHIIENENEWVVNEGVSMGAAKWLTVNRYNEQKNNTLDCIQHLKQQGYCIAATTPHKDDFTLSELPLDRPTALVFGAELRGISDLVMEHADRFVQIPMHGFTESFNISVAAALCLYELSTRIRTEVADWQLSEAEQEALLFEWAQKSVRDSHAILDRYSE
jgi:tRNA (guanosine-2'-O-)-methyltransferase